MVGSLKTSTKTSLPELPSRPNALTSWSDLMTSSSFWGNMSLHSLVKLDTCLEPQGQLFINGCFNGMIPNLYIENGCFTKHPFINGCLGLQVVICHKSRVPETLKQFQPILKIVRLFFPKIGDNKTIHFQQKNTPQNEHGTHKNWWCASMFLLLKTGYFQVNQPFVFGEGTFPETNSHDVLDRNLGGVAGWPESSRCS